MSLRYTDIEIAALLAEPKWGKGDLLHNPMRKRGHLETRVVVERQGGGEFHLFTRRNSSNPFDFSIILGIRAASSNRIFRLRRHNGTHMHTNRIERQSFDCFHIHLATERYQDLGLREDAYAEPTDRFGDFNGAMGCMLRDANFRSDDDRQQCLPLEYPL